MLCNTVLFEVKLPIKPDSAHLFVPRVPTIVYIYSSLSSNEVCNYIIYNDLNRRLQLSKNNKIKLM